MSEEDELRDYDPTQEGGGGPCERCGYVQEPWRFSRLCQACIWDQDLPSGSNSPGQRGVGTARVGASRSDGSGAEAQPTSASGTRQDLSGWGCS